jgi:hypothetical protein
MPAIKARCQENKSADTRPAIPSTGQNGDHRGQWDAVFSYAMVGATLDYGYPQ